MLKNVLQINIYEENMIQLLQNYLKKIYIFGNFLIFDQFDSSMLNKSINFFKNIYLNYPKLLNGGVCKKCNYKNVCLPIRTISK